MRADGRKELVALTLTVTRAADGSTADTASITITLPAQRRWHSLHNRRIALEPRPLGT
ncbi:hypothetical protein GCM10010412_088100 [Nonomuraea recticatena]|uniref:Uncharacterized protein n=2 Tax=Nonomuraea recticatena TaxID=46178 RepID=A0ABP6FL63_9ACTN